MFQKREKSTPCHFFVSQNGCQGGDSIRCDDISSVEGLNSNSRNDIMRETNDTHGGEKNVGRKETVNADRGGIGGLSAGAPYQGGRNPGNQRDVSVGDPEGTFKTADNFSHREHGASPENSGLGGMDELSQAADITKTTSGEIPDGRRFLEAIKNGNEKDARSLLDKKEPKDFLSREGSNCLPA